MNVSTLSIADASNRDLKNMAKMDAKVRSSVDTAKDAGAALLLVPAAAIVSEGAFSGHSLGTKLTGVAKSAGRWGGIFATLIAYTSATHAASENIPALKKFKTEHPYVATAANFIGAGAALVGVGLGFDKLKSAIAAKSPDLVKNIKNTGSEIRTLINGSWVNKKMFVPVLENARKLAAKLPQVVRTAGKTAAIWSPVIIGGAYMYKIFVANPHKERKMAVENYHLLKAVREDVRSQVILEDFADEVHSGAEKMAEASRQREFDY